MMHINKAREIVINAGHQLLAKGLIARTWGNVSCRINSREFLITPSGRAYETLTPEEIVTVKIADGSYDGPVEPSSEKDVHAEVYRRRPEINFIIHTHQPLASALSPAAMDIDVIDPGKEKLLGKKIISVPYARSGSNKLRENIGAAVSIPGSKAYLMTAHGALCLGRNDDEAFQVAYTLEQACTEYLLQHYRVLTGNRDGGLCDLRNYFASTMAPSSSQHLSSPKPSLGSSAREGESIIWYPEATESDPFPEQESKVYNFSLSRETPVADLHWLPSAIYIHREIYRTRSDIRAIIHARSPNILTFSRTGKTIAPYLDDFAQIIGINARCLPLPQVTALEKRETGVTTSLLAANKLRGRKAIMLQDEGALCCGPSKSDAAAALTVLDKNCLAAIASALLGRGQPINLLECILMHHIYLKSYSLKAATVNRAKT